ncbi:quinone-dependent dihydroorotate dehydrogenase [Jiangella muralis]|uniref:quinone-dependent dihydroorotate dehydrogenase n=1 Tax=Jiangella muralis TaxID=702383 RepID=UPI00069F072F|nr:quinone-dependent dihydroorotate dehydrogenase [Jiangella muralis]
MVYRTLVKPALFRMDPERAHHLTIDALARLGRVPCARDLARRRYRHRDARLSTRFAGLWLENPIGMAAGFDKNGLAVSMLTSLGLGHVEIGSISASASLGNPTPRLFRLPDDEAVLVSYGVPNDGAQAVRDRLRGSERRVPIGVNLVKTNDGTPPTRESVTGDFLDSFTALAPLADFVTLNLSCPNTTAETDYFDDIDRVGELLTALGDHDPAVPIVLKIKPTTDRGRLSDLVAVARETAQVKGIAINLPSASPGDYSLVGRYGSVATRLGAVSGPPVRSLIDAVLRHLAEILGPRSGIDLVAAGGVTSGDDAYRKLRLGASVVQLYTALIYRGPQVTSQILAGIASHLEADGFEQVGDAVGADVWSG